MQELYNDLHSAIRRWRDSRIPTDYDLPWINARDLYAYSRQSVDQATSLLARSSQQPTELSPTAAASICVVTKRPHVTTSKPLAAIIARLIGFGLPINNISRLTRPTRAAKTLYPKAYASFTALPTNPTTWDALANRFDNDYFRTIFGSAYLPSMVMTGKQVMATFKLRSADLTRIWETGHVPILRADVTARYGAAAAELILTTDDSYQWFRGKWPIGIHRIESGLMAFAIRHERLGGRPLIILNGHYPGLKDLFGDTSTIISTGAYPSGPHISQVRQWVIGYDNRPQACQPGSIRRDAADHQFPADSSIPVDLRMNVIHCSDGLLAGMIESYKLLDQTFPQGELAEQLKSHGLTTEEIRTIVAADPLIELSDGQYRLTDLTTGLTFDDCLKTVLNAVPPVFGARNGFASGLTIPTLGREFTRLRTKPGANDVGFDAAVRPLSVPPIALQELPSDMMTAGVRAIEEQLVAMVVPAGGTGGRFGGYELPESDPRRQKALVQLFMVENERRNALDIRAANVRYWQRQVGKSIPIAVMASPTNYAALQLWCSRASAFGLDKLVLFQQFGTYRLAADRWIFEASREEGWINSVLRREDGSPVLRPPGNLCAFTCLVLSGTLREWADSGVKYLAMANVSDVGYRLDPAIVGLLETHQNIDAVVVGVPWGVKGFITRDGKTEEVHGDVSGYCITESGEKGALTQNSDGSWRVDELGEAMELRDARLDVGGAICDIRTDAGWRPGVSEVGQPERVGELLFNTNQMYLRMSALDKLLNLHAHRSVVNAVREFTSSQPFHAERKVVTLGRRQVDALQLNQTIGDILVRLFTRPALLTRYTATWELGRYAPIKRPADVPFAQILLDRLAAHGDALSFPSELRAFAKTSGLA